MEREPQTIREVARYVLNHVQDAKHIHKVVEHYRQKWENRCKVSEQDYTQVDTSTKTP